MSLRDCAKLKRSRILVIPLRYVGDTILTVPVLRNLKQAYPDAQLSVWTSKVGKGLLELCPYISDLIEEPRGFMRQLDALKTGQFDAVFILRKSFTSALQCKLAGIPLVVGYDKQRFFKPLHYKRWGVGLDIVAPYPSLKTKTHQVHSHLNMLKLAGVPVENDFLELWTTPEDDATVVALLTLLGLADTQKLAGLHAVSASHGKDVPSEKFIPALQTLRDQGYTILTTGTETDRFAYDLLAQQANVSLVNLAGKTTLRQLVSLYRKLSVLVTVDSAPLHMAAAVGVPHVVGVFGPTNADQWAPLNPSINFTPVFNDLPCRPCYPKVCSHNNCRMQLDPEQIKAALG